jgi:hypothetical protein
LVESRHLVSNLIDGLLAAPNRLLRSWVVQLFQGFELRLETHEKLRGCFV